MKIEIVGAGVVGGAFGQALVARGEMVQWIDSNPERVQRLRNQGFQAALPEEETDPCELYFLCVQTPTVAGEQVRTGLKESLERIATLLRPELSPTVVIRSTILPGTSREWAIPYLERASGLRRSEHFRFVYYPEFLRERHAAADVATPRIHLLGECEPGDGDVVAKILAAFAGPIVRVSLEAAELQKYIHNNFNTLKIGYFNEMRRVAAQLNLTAQTEAIFSVTGQSAEGMWNPAYGTRDWGSVSGNCLPKDLDAFLGWMQSRALVSPLLEGLNASKSMESKRQDAFSDPLKSIRSD
jgi:nucleotide sugar dehydrogenase